MARSREFEPEEALDKAMHAFWRKGYFDTSIRDLIEATGVNYYGLYDAFDSKHGLFLAALDHYRKTVTAEIVEILRQPGPIQKSLNDTLEGVLKLMKTADGRVGCLMCNTAVELTSHDTDAAEKVRNHAKLLQSSFRARLSEAQSSGEISKTSNAKALAEFLTTAVYTIGLLVRSGHDDAYVRRHIKSVLSIVG